MLENGGYAFGIKMAIAAPRELDRHPSLISLTRLAKPHFYLQNPTPSDFLEKLPRGRTDKGENDFMETPFFCHCERCLHRVAIHKQKADSSMDRHADKSARDDRVFSKVDSRIKGIK